MDSLRMYFPEDDAGKLIISPRVVHISSVIYL
jgi:hypothetical protein